MKNKYTFKILILFFVGINSVKAQDLLDKLGKEFPEKPVFTIATFKTTRIGLGQSIETRKKGALEISLFNRYWNIPDFPIQRFLADKVNIRFGLDYAFSDSFTFGFGHSNYDKITDGTLKYKLIKQQSNSKKALFSVTLFQGISHRKTTSINTNLYGNTFSTTNSSKDKYSFTSQVLIARKINPKLSLQLTPTFIHREANSNSNDPNNQFAIGFSGRHKINSHASIISEYYYVANPIISISTYNAFTVGLNWELSHLLLQFKLTNARNFVEDSFITQTINNFNFKNPNLHFGFNATWVLQTKKNKLK